MFYSYLLETLKYVNFRHMTYFYQIPNHIFCFTVIIIIRRRTRWEPSHSGQLCQLGLEPLGPHMLMICRTFAEGTARDSRHMDLFVPSGARPRKGKLVKTYREPKSRTVTHYNSALPYLTRLLNSD